MRNPRRSPSARARWHRWHLGWLLRKYTPCWRGFATFRGSSGNTDDYWYHLNGNHCPKVGKVSAYDYVSSTAPAADGSSAGTFDVDLAHNGTYDTRVLGAHSLDIVKQHNISRGLYLYFAFHAVHVAMNAPLETVERFPHTASDARKVTNAMLLELDWAVGNLSLALHAREMDERTVWIFHTDNGAPGSHGCNWPHRGHKFSFWYAIAPNIVCLPRGIDLTHERVVSWDRSQGGRRERRCVRFISASPCGAAWHAVHRARTPGRYLPDGGCRHRWVEHRRLYNRAHPTGQP